MSDTTHDMAGLIALMTRAIDAVRPGGVFSSNSKLSAALFALYEAMPALTALQAERDAWKARADLPPTLSSALAVPEVTVMWHALLTWDAAHRTGKNEPLQVAFELGQSALAGLKGNNNV